MPLVGWPYFYLVFEISALGLIIGLAISKVELIGRKITIGLLE